MIEQAFLELMISHGLNPGQVIADDKWHRFPIKKTDRDGYYNLNPQGYGVFGNWKTSEQFKFCSGKSELMTDQERFDANAKYRQQIKKQKEEKFNAEAKAATECTNLWNECIPAPEDHWYLAKKEIKPHNTRVDKSGTLIVPIYGNGKIVNIQRINKDGKRFFPQAKKKGCYGKIKGDKDIVFIAEGFATAATINEATGKQCIVALDAGNLLPVAKHVRQVFGVGQKIIIAADNDQWTEIKGKKHNTGLVEASAAGLEIYAEIKFPEFPENDDLKRSDWNDYGCAFGLQAVKDLLLPVNEKPLQIIDSEGFDVFDPLSKVEEIEFDLDANGKPKCTIENLDKVASKHRIILRYNVIKKQEEILIPNESYSLDNGLNAAYARIVSLCKAEDMPTSQIGDYLTYLCDKVQYNPVTTWILSKPWDGKSRLEEFFDTVQSPNKDIKEIILNRWMISAIASAFSENGLATRGVLVFQGEQYLGKTSWFKKLVPAHLDVRKDGYILRLDDKDNIFQCLSHWLIELGELEATFKKSDIAQLKAFIPMDKDIMRRPYARKDSQYGRRTVFFASVNQKEFLFDETGNTRFWSIETTAINYNHDLDMQQVWAEFHALWTSGEGFIMSAEEMKMINTNNEEFMGPDYHDELAARRFQWEDLKWQDGVWKTVTEICHQVAILNPKQSDLNKMAKAIRKHNGDKTKRGVGGVRLLLVPEEKISNEYRY